ncbi:hypothetical protein EON65_28480 [archaeon]|nr:MAG: hypothetical protein EON65_28480 [archaeon]
MDVSSVIQSLSSKPQQTIRRYAYGTAGFRDRYHETMHHLFVRVGILAALRSLVCAGKCTGVMVTASHNTEEDNGVKIVDVDGGMLVKKWEVMAEVMANESLDYFIASILAILSENDCSGTIPVVMIGQDTRWHSPVLVECVKEGVELLGGQVLSVGQVITPVVHFCVNAFNEAGTLPSEFSSHSVKKGYYEQLYRGYSDLIKTGGRTTSNSIVLDTANGVGSITTQDFLACVGSLPGWNLSLVNKAGEGSVNADCGAEHVQKLQIPPAGIDVESYPNTLLCSFDGDGDRIVFHGMNAGRWILLDGDRIASLVATFLLQEVKEAGLAEHLSVGIVQTAYANGASTAYLRSLGISVVFAKTGVKYLHHAAQSLDVGIYFEANGHGTVIFSAKAQEKVLFGAATGSSERQKLAFIRLQACLMVINQTIGDALSDLLLTLAILQVRLIKYAKLTLGAPSYFITVVGIGTRLLAVACNVLGFT